MVIGSQAILGSFPNAPPELTQSLDADVFPRDAPERSILIDGAIGELSLFHETFGYYAHGVDDTTAILPSGWQDRLVKIETPGTMGAVGWCLEPNDLAVSKLLAGRQKDLPFVETMLRKRLASRDVVRQRLADMPRLSDEARQRAMAWLKQWQVD